MRASLSELQPSLIRQIHALKTPDSIDLSLGEPALRIDPVLWDRGLARHQREPRGYTPNLGMPALREAIGAYHGVKADNVIVTVGSEEALFLSFYTLLDAGDEVIIPELCYPAYAGIAAMIGAVPVRVPMREHALSADAVAAALTPRTRLVVVASPSNPFGRIDAADQLDALAQLRQQHGFEILSDEIYRELYFHERPEAAGTVVVSGLSKSCAMTGDRLGYVIASTDLVKAMWPVHQLTVTCAPTFAQQLALEAFLDPHFLSAHRPEYVARWHAAKAALDMYKVPYIEPQGAFFVMCPIVPPAEDAFAFCKRVLAEQDVVMVPGTAFGPAGQRFVRLSFAGDPAAFARGVGLLSSSQGK